MTTGEIDGFLKAHPFGFKEETHDWLVDSFSRIEPRTNSYTQVRRLVIKNTTLLEQTIAGPRWIMGCAGLPV